MDKGYSKYIRPLKVFLDLLILNLLLHFMVFEPGYMSDATKDLRFLFVANIGWLILSYILKIYKVFRYTRLARIIRNLTNQITLFFLLFSSLFAWSYLLLDKKGILSFFFILSSLLFVMRLIFYFAIRNYRSLGGNCRKVIIVGYQENSKLLHKIFKQKSEFGYQFLGFFSDKSKDKKNIKGKIRDVKEFVLQNEVDEIYCTVGELNKKELKCLIDFAENNLKVIKFIPESKGVYGKSFALQYHDFLPILALRENPFEDSVIKWSKRIFDITFSSLVTVFILSWLVPILGFFIKQESKGPIFFKQKRNGLDNKEFGVYKFRSMGVNMQSEDIQAKRNDPRVTKIGSFIRKSSIDELPQFINVFKGEMSVVGPRPHMVSQTNFYSKKIDKYMVRHFVKPGITGLSQVRGFRGETETVDQMRSRSRIDRFYIENWSMLLDFKIIVQTVFNAIKGENNAY
ncbi:MAG: undecaprenyl-phosphate glucose phosphotransferase [Bacteroidota bacterium]